MRIISTAAVKGFYSQTRYQDAENVMKTWIAVTRKATWSTPIEVKQSFAQTDILPNGRAVFDVGGNKYRIVAKINYRAGIVFVRFVGTHAQYDNINAATI